MPPHNNIVELEATLRRHFEKVLAATQPVNRVNGNTKYHGRGYCGVAEVYLCGSAPPPHTHTVALSLCARHAYGY